MSNVNFLPEIIKAEEMMHNNAKLYWVHLARGELATARQFGKLVVLLAEIETVLQYGRQRVFPEDEPVWVRKARTYLTNAAPSNEEVDIFLLRSVWFNGSNDDYLDISRSSNAGVEPGGCYDPESLLWGFDSQQVTTIA